MDSPQHLAALAERAARAAGALLIEHAGRPPQAVDTKSSLTDMVSEADRAAERLLVDVLRRERPEDAILGEEGAAEAGKSGLRWVIDPLDGTTNFLYRYPQWGVSVSCEDAQGPIAGCVFDPSRDEAFVAARGAGARLNGAPIAVSAPAGLATTLLATGFGYDAQIRAGQAAAVAGIIRSVRDIRRGGAAAIDLAWVACGRIDAYYEAGLNPWDWSAGVLLVQEAGGSVGRVSPPGGRETIVAAGPSVFGPLRDLVASVPSVALDG